MSDYPVKKTGSADNERLQINKALESIFQTLARADSWDEAASWGDHNKAGYATALSELEQFAEFGIPGTPTLNKTRETSANGTEVHAIEATWPKAGDETIVYDLEIRESDPDTVINASNTADILDKSTPYAVPIVSNDTQDTVISYKSFFDANTRYWFRVRFRKNILVSNWSPFSNITTTPNEDTPAAPTSLAASAISDGVSLSWNYDFDANFNVAKIEILRDGVLIDSVARPALTYIDEPLTLQQQYTYTVRARTFQGIQSLASNSASATPLRSTITIYATEAPNERPDESPLRDGDRWVDTDDGNRPYTRVGTSWVQEYTKIPGNNINPGTMDADRIVANSITATQIDTNSINVSSFNDDIGIATEDGVNVTIRATSAPGTRSDGSPLRIGDIWLDTDDGDLPHSWNGVNWIRMYTRIDGGDIVTGTVAANRIDVTTIINDNDIVTGDVARPDDINVTIRSSSQPSTRPDTTALRIGDVWIETDAGDLPYSWNGSQWIRMYTIIDGGNLVTGSVDANKIDVTNLIVKNLQTNTSGPRVEITDPTIDATYALWAGDGTKDDTASFWVKHNGTVFINKQEFGITDGQVNVGAFSNANTSTGGFNGTSVVNTLVAQTPSAIAVGSGGIKFEVNFFFVASTSTNNVADNLCPTGTTVSGEIELLRNTSNTLSGATSIQTLTFSSPDIRDWVEEGGSLAPGVCQIRSNTDTIKVFVDNTAVAGNSYYYFVRFSQWNANSYQNVPVNEVFTNTLYVTWTTGN